MVIIDDHVSTLFAIANFTNSLSYDAQIRNYSLETLKLSTLTTYLKKTSVFLPFEDIINFLSLEGGKALTMVIMCRKSP